MGDKTCGAAAKFAHDFRGRVVVYVEEGIDVEPKCYRLSTDFLVALGAEYAELTPVASDMIGATSEAAQPELVVQKSTEQVVPQRGAGPGCAGVAAGAEGRVLSRLLARLPERFRWTVHNLVAHPASELLYQLGARRLADVVHDATVPEHVAGEGRG